MKSIWNRAPLTPNHLTPLSLGSIHPEGWLKKQLETQAKGILERFPTLWPDDAPVSVRAAYDLAARVALAWTLDDAELQEEVTRRIETLMENQRADGWFGAESDDDYWPRIVILGAVVQYFTATSDKRALVFLDRFCKYQYRNLAVRPLNDWACARGADNIWIALWLYNLTGQEYLLSLSRKLQTHLLDWPNIFHTFPNIQPVSRSMAWDRLSGGMKEEAEGVKGTNRPYFSTFFHQSQAANVASGLKAPGVISLFKSGFKEQGGFTFGWTKLMKAHGVACGLFTGDGHLNGANPSQGVESEAVIEAMNSLITLLGIGDFGSNLPDILEKLAFNALPAAFNATMTACQCDQQVNQVCVSDAPHGFYNRDTQANLFGMHMEDERCAAILQQGFPRFAASLWYATNDGGLSAISYAPCTLRTRIDTTPIKLEVRGEYPFSDTVTITVSAKHPIEFPMYLRMPSWAKQPVIHLPDGEIMTVHAGETTCVRRRWMQGDVVRIEMPMEPRLTRWMYQSAAVELGPLVMAYQPDEEWTRVDGEGDRAPLWQVTTNRPWKYALVRDEPMKAIFETDAGRPFKQGAPNVRVLAKVANVPEWNMDGASCQRPPIAPPVDHDALTTISLVPYGDTALRIAQFPFTEPIRTDVPV